MTNQQRVLSLTTDEGTTTYDLTDATEAEAIDVIDRLFADLTSRKK